MRALLVLRQPPYRMGEHPKLLPSTIYAQPLVAVIIIYCTRLNKKLKKRGQ